MMPGCFAARCPSIQAATRSSHGRRSASVNGIPACILATFASGCRASPSSNGQPSRAASSSADGRLARARDAHDHEDRRTAAMGARAVEAVDAARVGDEDRIRAADEEAAFHHPDDAADALLQPRRIGDAGRSRSRGCGCRCR